MIITSKRFFAKTNILQFRAAPKKTFKYIFFAQLFTSRMRKFRFHCQDSIFIPTLIRKHTLKRLSKCVNAQKKLKSVINVKVAFAASYASAYSHLKHCNDPHDICQQQKTGELLITFFKRNINIYIFEISIFVTKYLKFYTKLKDTSFTRRFEKRFKINFAY